MTAQSFAYLALLYAFMCGGAAIVKVACESIKRSE